MIYNVLCFGVVLLHFRGHKMALSGSNILFKLELIYILKLKLYSLHFTSLHLSFKKCCSIRNYYFSLTEKQDGVPEQVESMLGDAVSNVAFDLYTGILSYVY